MSKKIYIDAGHGGSNPGATYGKRKESEDVYKLSTAVLELLKAQGFETKLSRTAATDPDLNVRTKEANSWKADYFISIHRNAFSPNKAQGTEVWIYSKAETTGNSYKYAKNILDKVIAAAGYKDRGIKKGAPSYTDYAVNRDTNMPACLLEVGFVDSDADNKIFDAKLDATAEAITKAICENFGVTYSEESVKASAAGNATGTEKAIYRVQVGAFSKKENAEAYAEKLKKAGYSAVVTVIGDLTGDGKVTAEDARINLRKATGLEE